MIVGIVGTMLGLHRPRDARRLADSERNAAVAACDESEAVLDYPRDVLAAANPYRTGREVTVIELPREAKRRLGSELADRPGVEAGVRYGIASAYAGMWFWQDVTVQSTRALELNRRLYGNVPPRVADCLTLLGRARTFAKDPKSIALPREAVRIRRQLFGEGDPRVAKATGNLGYALWYGSQRPQWEEAERHYRSALAMYQKSPVDGNDDVARFTFSLAVMLMSRGDYQESERLYLDCTFGNLLETDMA